MLIVEFFCLQVPDSGSPAEGLVRSEVHRFCYEIRHATRAFTRFFKLVFENKTFRIYKVLLWHINTGSLSRLVCYLLGQTLTLWSNMDINFFRGGKTFGGAKFRIDVTGTNQGAKYTKAILQTV